jgi:hypothetical protein
MAGILTDDTGNPVTDSLGNVITDSDLTVAAITITDHLGNPLTDYLGNPITIYGPPYQPWTGTINFPGSEQFTTVVQQAINITALVIPLDNAPNQTLETTVFVDGSNVKLRLTFNFNEIAGYWIMSITDPTTSNLLIDSIPLVVGVYPASNIIQQYAYLGLGSAYVVPMGGSPLDFPDANTLGSYFCLVWGDSPNVLNESLSSAVV